MIKRIARKIIKFLKKRPDKYLLHDEFWIQKINTETIKDRVSYFEAISVNKDVLHFGCNDWPIFDPSYNLHIKLSKRSKSLHGFDVDIEGIENLKQYVDQKYYSEFSELIGNEYDICLVPETIEHVDNVRTFLEGLSTVNAKIFYITAPNCFAKKHIERNLYSDNQFIEVVHPDHNCWYSPFTLKNQIEKYSNLQVDKVFLLDDDTMICCQASKKQLKNNEKSQKYN